MPNPRFIRELFNVCRSCGLTVAPLALTIVTSCHRTVPESAARINAASAGVSAFFNANFNGIPSVADIAGFNDAQRLPGNGSNDYGAIVRLYVAPQAPTQTQEDAGALVALMEVAGGDGHPLAAYNMLKIGNDASPTLYCVFLKSGNPAGSYDGYVTPVTSNGTTCTPIGTNNQYKLSASEVDATETDVPYVARFVEDANGKPAIGVGCGTPPNFVFCHLGRGVGTGKKALADEQELAIPAAGNTPPVSRSSIQGRITPGPKPTGFGTTPVFVATISLSAAPPNPSKYNTWGLALGDNGVWISKDAQNNWWAQFVPGTAAPTTETKYSITRTDHSAQGTPTVPVAARWAWSDTDEDVWVACDQGCCTISGITDQGNARGHNGR